VRQKEITPLGQAQKVKKILYFLNTGSTVIWIWNLFPHLWQDLINMTRLPKPASFVCLKFDQKFTVSGHRPPYLFAHPGPRGGCPPLSLHAKHLCRVLPHSPRNHISRPPGSNETRGLNRSLPLHLFNLGFKSKKCLEYLGYFTCTRKEFYERLNPLGHKCFISIYTGYPSHPAGHISIISEPKLFFWN